MLVLIFGIWVNVAHIGYLEEPSFSDDCYARFPTGHFVSFKDKTCDEVAVEINKHLSKGE